MSARPLLAAAVVLVLARSAAAGEYHAAGRMNCYDCHFGHGSNGLLGGGEVQTCRLCHDGGSGSVADVFGANDVPDAVSLEWGRSGGGLVLAGQGGAEGYGDDDGHTIGSLAPPPGYVGAWSGPLTCRSCHAVHGNAAYRNLGLDPILPAQVSWSSASQPAYGVVADATAARGAAGADVWVTKSRWGDGRNYDAGAISLSGNGGRNAMNAFCAACHTVFHGVENTGASSGFMQHPNSGVAVQGEVRRAVDAQLQPIRLVWRDSATAEIACVSCHRAHGTRNPFGLVFWEAQSERNGEDGAGWRFERLCLSCHDVSR